MLKFVKITEMLNTYFTTIVRMFPFMWIQFFWLHKNNQKFDTWFFASFWVQKKKSNGLILSFASIEQEVSTPLIIQ